MNKTNVKTGKLLIIFLISVLAVLSAFVFIERIEKSPGGIAIEFTIRTLDADNNGASGENHPVAGKEAVLTFKLTDNKTGKPITDMSPDVRFYLPGEHDDTREHEHSGGYHFTNELNLAKVQLFVLNSERGTIEVLDAFGSYDPRPQAIKSMGTMTSKVITLRAKQKIGDMVAGRYGDYIYATLPGENQVAVVNTISKEVVKYIDAGPAPGRLFLQPESKFLWVGNDGEDSVSIIDTTDNTLARTIDTGKGYHQIAFSPENAYVTNSQVDTVSVVRLDSQKKLEDIKVGGAPYGIAYSKASKEVYVTNVLSGTVTVIDAATRGIKKHIPLSTGIETIKFSPDGRMGVVLGKHANTAYIIDAVAGSLIKAVKTGEAPDSVAFMEEYALVRNTYSPDVTYINMDNPDISNNEPAGIEPPLTGNPGSIVVTSYGDEAVITSPKDTKIYFMHKMNGQPMVMNSATVEFGGDAAVIVENRIHETSPGTYRQYIMLSREGPYAIEFRTQKKTPYLNTGTMGINATFEIEVLPDQTTGPQVVALFKNKNFIPGSFSALQYNIADRKTGQPVENLTDLSYLVIKPTTSKGTWTKRLSSKHTGNGTYEARINFPEEGDYMVTLISSTLKKMGYETVYDYVTVRNRSK